MSRSQSRKRNSFTGARPASDSPVQPPQSCLTVRCSTLQVWSGGSGTGCPPPSTPHITSTTAYPWHRLPFFCETPIVAWRRWPPISRPPGGPRPISPNPNLGLQPPGAKPPHPLVYEHLLAPCVPLRHQQFLLYSYPHLQQGSVPSPNRGLLPT